MSYISGSEGPSVSGYDVQGPKSLPNTAFGKAFQPTAITIYEKCDRIFINADTGSCFLLYNTTASVGTTMDVADGTDSVLNFQDPQNGATSEIGGKAYVTMESGSVTPQSFELPFGAMAYSGSDGFTSANITFIYKGGL